jgi:hypothetical protein
MMVGATIAGPSWRPGGFGGRARRDTSEFAMIFELEFRRK